MNDEPVTSGAVLSAAVIATVNVLAIVFNWSSDTVSAVNLAVGAWVVAVAFFIRSKVTPLVNPTLTQSQIDKAQGKLT
jgi:fatty acid desaturase